MLFSFPVFLFFSCVFRFFLRSPGLFLLCSALSHAKPQLLTCVLRFFPRNPAFFSCVPRSFPRSPGLFLLRSALFPAKPRPFSLAFFAFSRKTPAFFSCVFRFFPRNQGLLLAFSAFTREARPFSLAFFTFARETPASYLRFSLLSANAVQRSPIPGKRCPRLKRRCISPEGCRSRKIPLLRSAARHPPPDPPSPQRP